MAHERSEGSVVASSGMIRSITINVPLVGSASRQLRRMISQRSSPIVEDALHQDRVGTARNRFEKTSRDEPAAIGDAKPIEMRPRSCLAAGEIEGDALEMRVMLEHAADQFAGASSDIQDKARDLEVVGRDDFWNDAPREADHRGVEPADEFRRVACRGIAIVAIAAQLACALPGANRFDQSAPGLREHLALE